MKMFIVHRCRSAETGYSCPYLDGSGIVRCRKVDRNILSTELQLKKPPSWCPLPDITLPDQVDEVHLVSRSGERHIYKTGKK